MTKLNRLMFNKIIQEICLMLSISLVVFVVLEIFFPRSVEAFISLPLWFIFWLVSAIMLILNNQNN